MIEFISHGESDTFEFAKNFAKSLKGGECIALSGDLGVGKTVFTKGLAAGLGINDSILSPTFTIVREYDSEICRLNHFDVYRISDPEEMYEIGFDEYISSGSINVIEWAGLIDDILPKDRIDVKIERLSDDDRLITVCYNGDNK